MSGIFKHFDRVIPASIFSNNSHKLRLYYQFARTNAASYYFNPLIRLHGLPQSHDLDLNQLASCQYNLLRQTNNYNQLLGAAKQHANILQELQEEIVKNQFALESLNNAVKLQLQIGNQNLTIDTACSVIYSLSNQGKKEELATFLNNYSQIINAKIQYASDQNLIDLVQGLTQAEQFENKGVWKNILNTCANRTWNWELQAVQMHGWETSVYETKQEKKSKKTFSKNIYQYYLNSANSPFASVTKNLYQLTEQILFRVVYPVLHRENRIQYSFDCIDQSEEKTSFFATLANLDGKVEGSQEILNALKQRQQTY